MEGCTPTPSRFPPRALRPVGMPLMFKTSKVILEHRAMPKHRDAKSKMTPVQANSSSCVACNGCIFQLTHSRHKDFHITKKNDENPLFPANHPFDCDYDGIRHQAASAAARPRTAQTSRQCWGIQNRVTFVCRKVTKKQDSNKPRMLVTLSHRARLCCPIFVMQAFYLGRVIHAPNLT
jgi:hypothetical protein